MTDDMAGKVALLTGSASGIGEAAARELAARGATVVIADRDDELGPVTAKSIGDNAHFRRLDVAQESEWIDLIGWIRSELGSLNVLVNCAGICRPALIEDIDFDMWLTTMTVNAGGTLLGCKHSIPLMSETSGSIINLSSITTLAGQNVMPAYASSKGAISTLTLTLAAHCRHEGYPIRVNAVLPGGTTSRLVEGFGAEVVPILQARAAAGKPPTSQPGTPVALAEPGQIAPAIAFLASDAAEWINGAEIVVDGGQTRMMATQL